MELQTFVAETLAQIVEGVAQARQRCRAAGARVNPAIRYTTKDAMTTHGLFATDVGAMQLVHFDVAIAATEGTGTKGGIGVVVGAFTLGSSGQSQAEKSASSRVQFVVPLALPGDLGADAKGGGGAPA
jgi:hypothetical protein